MNTNTFRDQRDLRQRYEMLAQDVKCKEMQIKDMQHRLESGEGCKFFFLF